VEEPLGLSCLYPEKGAVHPKHKKSLGSGRS
jgi:hypothetical protein